ncbi:endolytic transglycosylase MltG [Halalkalibacter nanhaiisediminis]|uniref:YceG-like family protein n=1 Tax=Halalkalibacter nanhaiisediminis TaxID=688079 RepID=A0A562QP19_9BACI|nr:endolytic transglycosylase MltG [Halalkalibacter nanhaiisediminis]TWI57806.1 YceG-like family protein [Halalkalibacter nanhaiisediminis]
MSSKGLQSFSSGLFLATAILGGIYYFAHEPEQVVSQPVSNIDLTPAEMKQELEEVGYIVFSEEEWVQEQERSSQKESDSAESDSEVNEQIIYTMNLIISSGMTSNEVANQLVRGQIIEDRAVFLDYVHANQLTQSLQVGEYQLRSDMTIEDILDQLT